MYSENLFPQLLAASALTIAFVGAPIWIELAQRARARRLLGGSSLLLGIGLAITTLAALPVRAQVIDPIEPARPVITDSEIPEPVVPPAAPLPAESADRSPPVAAVVLPNDRPAWVEANPVLEGDVHRVSVSSDFHARAADAVRALDDALLKATRDYISDYLTSHRAPMFFSFSLEEIKARFLKPENVYHEVVQVSFGPMHQSHALLEFPADFRQQLDERWNQVRAAGNLVKIGGGTVGVLVLLLIVFGYFRLDTATRGYYTSRLQFLAAVAILALIVAGFVFARSTAVWVQWLLL